MKISINLILSYLTIVVILISLSVYSIYSLGSINKDGVDMYEERIMPITKLGNISRLAEKTRVYMLGANQTMDTTYTDNAQKNIEEVNYLIEQYQMMNMSAEERALFEKFLQNWTDYTVIVKNNISLVHQGNAEELAKGVQRAGQPYFNASANLGELLALNEQITSSLLAESQSKYSGVRLLLTIVSVFAAGFAIVIGIVMVRMISNYISEIKGKTIRVAEGDQS